MTRTVANFQTEERVRSHSSIRALSPFEMEVATEMLHIAGVHSITLTKLKTNVGYRFFITFKKGDSKTVHRVSESLPVALHVLYRRYLYADFPFLYPSTFNWLDFWREYLLFRRTTLTAYTTLFYLFGNAHA